MAINSKIEWTHHTANLWHGCTKVNAGCDHCYAETLSNRWKRDIWGNDKPRMIIRSVWDDLKKQQAAAAAAGETHRVFVGSMMDIFEKPMPLIDSKGNEIAGQDTGFLRDLLFQHIQEGLYQNLLFLFLTKRPSNISKYIPPLWMTYPPENIMFGTSPCDQATADTLIPQLAQVHRRFLSIEPLLGPINLLKEYPCGKGSIPYGALMSWVIVGGESGNKARPMHPDWIRSIRDQCKQADIPLFFKQWGNLLPKCQEESAMPSLITVNAPIVEFQSPNNPDKKNIYYRIPKYIAGRRLDGQIYDEFPVIN